jgi:hypothetical protein
LDIEANTSFGCDKYKIARELIIVPHDLNREIFPRNTPIREKIKAACK